MKFSELVRLLEANGFRLVEILKKQGPPGTAEGG
jgi:hypothetical protein